MTFREETVRSPFKPSQISTSLPAAWSSGKLHAVIQALWRSHLSGGNCSSHTLWTRVWPPSLTCDQYSFGIVVTANSFGREFGEFSYESLCSWGWALACPPMNWTVALMSPGVGAWLQLRSIHMPLRPDVVALGSSTDHGILLM